MSEERKLMSATEANVGLYPKYGLGASLLKGVSGFFLGVIPRYFTNKAIENWTRTGFFKMLKEGAQIEQGDIKDIVDKQVKMVELTLTNQNFFFLYEKGFMSKQQKLIAFPLEHAMTVEARKGKTVTVGYDVPQEGKDKPQHFDLIINLKDADNWAKTIETSIRS